MGLDANILCIGKFSEDIKNALDYSHKDDTEDEDAYADTAEGTIVISHLCNCNTTDQSMRLSDALGIEDPWDFNQHAFTEERVDWDELIELSDNCAEWDIDDVNYLRDLLNKGFLCIYQPNG